MSTFSNLSSSAPPSFQYHKRRNNVLFGGLKASAGISDAQNFIPLYRHIFHMNDTNYKTVNLRTRDYIYSISSKDESQNLEEGKEKANGIYICGVKNYQEDNDVVTTKKLFFKLAPLIDPFKYVSGTMQLDDEMLALPEFAKGSGGHFKYRSEYNAAYVDGFFVYLTCQLMEQFQFDHGIEFFGSFLGIKENFRLNITDDIEFLMESKVFRRNRGRLFTTDLDNDADFEEYMNIESSCDDDDDDDDDLDDDNDDDGLSEEQGKKMYFLKKKKNRLQKLNIHDDEILLHVIDIADAENEDAIINKDEKGVEDIHDEDEDDENENVIKDDDDDDDDAVDDVDDDADDNDNDDDNDDVNDDDDDDDDVNDDDDDNDELVGDGASSSSSSCSLSSSHQSDVYLTIPKFPVEVVVMEILQETLDSFLCTDSLQDEEVFAILFQIIMILCSYQDAFNFTHNDLHTNNIMFNTTNAEFIVYTYQGLTYRVPTYGKIFKIIDFGRAIYSFGTHRIASDSYAKGGDANSQYNTEPFFNPKKKRVDANLSFDLCRLGCSLLDCLVKDVDDFLLRKDEICNARPIVALVDEWCNDDKGKSVVYKANGEERYPDFSLYRMIARNVHKHTPHAQLKRDIFRQRFLINAKTKATAAGDSSLSSNVLEINIDKIPRYYNSVSTQRKIGL